MCITDILLVLVSSEQQVACSVSFSKTQTVDGYRVRLEASSRGRSGVCPELCTFQWFKQHQCYYSSWTSKTSCIWEICPPSANISDVCLLFWGSLGTAKNITKGLIYGNTAEFCFLSCSNVFIILGKYQNFRFSIIKKSNNFKNSINF